MKKAVLILLTLILAFSLYLPNNTYAKPIYNDVPTHHMHYDDIMYLVDRNVITDTSPNLGVNEIVTREEAAVMVIKAVGLDGTPRQTKFSDVPAYSKNSGYIQSAVEAGIINGTGPNTFSPNVKVNRSQMAAFIDRAFDLPQGTESFTDVPKTHFAYENIKNLVAAKIANGYGNGKFGPEDQLKRGQIAAFIARAMRFAEGDTIQPIPTPQPIPEEIPIDVKPIPTPKEDVWVDGPQVTIHPKSRWDVEEDLRPYGFSKYNRNNYISYRIENKTLDGAIVQVSSNQIPALVGINVSEKVINSPEYYKVKHMFEQALYYYYADDEIVSRIVEEVEKAKGKQLPSERPKITPTNVDKDGLVWGFKLNSPTFSYKGYDFALYERTIEGLEDVRFIMVGSDLWLNP